jgi:hypothetical protein
MDLHKQTNTIGSISKLLSNKKIEFTKIKKNIYKLESYVENNNIYLEKLIHFDLIHLFYKVNMDYFEVVDFEIVNENEAILFVLMKPLFKEFGVQSRYVNLKITKKMDKSNIYFICNSCSNFTSNTQKYNKAIKSPLINVNITCTLIHSHLLHITETLTFDETCDSFILIDKLLSQILKVIFKQTIKAIEQIHNK